MKKIITLILLLISINAQSQDTLTGKCWTPEMDTTEFYNLPWFDDNDYLEHFLDSIGYPQPGSGNRIVGSPVRFWIPIKFWIYRNDNGVGGPDPRQLRTLMDDLNRRFNQTNNAMIGFYMKCDPTYVNNSTHVIKTYTGASLLMAANNDNGSINVHVIGSFHSNAAGFSIPFLNAAMVPEDSYLFGSANGDLAHEVGHILGLQHTHQYNAWNWKCLTESVSRTRTWPTFNLCVPNRIKSKRVCESTGDGLRDTQADNNLVTNNACFYNVNFGNDEWGDSYDNPPAGVQDRPNFRNIMSYNSATDCVDQFSRLQIGVMLWTLHFKKTNNWGGWSNPISTFDDFEPDNEPASARNIQIGQVQERNFHQQWNKSGGYGYTTQCDVDWVRFVAPCSNNFQVFTSAMPGRINANTRLTLFNAALTQLAQNDNISQSNFFSSINWNFVAGQEYFIRVENMSTNVTGYYTLAVGNPFTNPLSISGNDNLCPSGTYSVTGLPPGATVSWSASPSNLVSFGCSTCPQTTINRIGNGTVTLTANISVTICGTVFTRPVSKQIYVGVPDNSQLSIWSSSNTVCPNLAMPFIALYTNRCTLLNAEWQVTPSNATIQNNSGFPCINENNTGVTISFPSYGTYSVSTRVQNSCGWSGWSQPKVIQVTCSGSYIVSPNPAASTVSIMQKNEPKVDITEIRIFDNIGNLKKQFKYGRGTKQTQLNISNLKDGIYFIEISGNKNKDRQQLLIQR